MSDDLEKTLLVHLRELARRESWRAYELPEGIAERPVPILRLLDKHGWVEVYRWKWVDPHPRPYENPSNLVPMRDPFGEWFSPLQSTAKDRTWKYLLENDTGEVAPEIRLTELGKAKLAELEVAGTSGHVRRTLVWVRDHVVPTVIARVLRALLAWIGLG